MRLVAIATGFSGFQICKESQFRTESLVPGFIPSNTVTIFSGDGGTGKSLLAQQLSVAAATNGKWLGQPVKHGPALFLTAEDDEAEVHRRAADILRAEGREFRDASNIVACSLAGMDASSASRERGWRPTNPIAAVQGGRAGCSAQAVVVINDTFGRPSTPAMKTTGQWRGSSWVCCAASVSDSAPLWCCWLIRLSPASAQVQEHRLTGWNNSARSRLYLERIVEGGYEPDPDARRLSVKKSNYGRVGGEITMKWRDGVFVADPVETSFDRTMVNYKAERVFLKLVELMAEQGRNISPSPGANYAQSCSQSIPTAKASPSRPSSLRWKNSEPERHQGQNLRPSYPEGDNNYPSADPGWKPK